MVSINESPITLRHSMSGFKYFFFSIFLFLFSFDDDTSPDYRKKKEKVNVPMVENTKKLSLFVRVAFSPNTKGLFENKGNKNNKGQQ